MSHAIVMTKQYKPFLNNAIQKHEKHKHQMDRENNQKIKVTF